MAHAKDLILEFDDDQYSALHTVCPETDIFHKIDKHDAAILIGISNVEEYNKKFVSTATESDVSELRDIFINTVGIPPSSVVQVSSLSAIPPRSARIRQTLSDTCRFMKPNSVLFLYISGPCVRLNEGVVILTQDFNKKGAHECGIYVTDIEECLATSKVEIVILILDCDNAEAFARPLKQRCKALQKHLYIICSSSNFNMSISDEIILKHGYLTFFLTFYFSRLRSSTLSLLELSEFLRLYTTPLSRFKYHATRKQMEQIPLLLGSDSDEEEEEEVEVDGNLMKHVIKKLVKPQPAWSEVLLTTWTYRHWLNSPQRVEDGGLLLGSNTFSSTPLLLHVYLTTLKSFALLLLEHDRLHLAKLKEKDVPRLREGVIAVVSKWISALAHSSHPQWSAYQSQLHDLDHKYVMEGLKEGIVLVSSDASD